MEKDGLTTRLASSRQEMPVGQGALASCLQYLRATSWKTPQPVSTLTLGLVTSIKLQQQGNGIPPPHFNNEGLKTAKLYSCMILR